MPDPRVLFDAGPLPGGTLFEAPLRVIRADRPEEVPEALAALAQAQDDGAWLAGYASYELGYIFSSKLRPLLPKDRATPLLMFGVFDSPTAPKPLEDTPATLSPLEPGWSLSDYAQAFTAIRDFIAAGDIYQANLTFPLHAHRTGSIDGLLARLRQRQTAPHGALVDLGGPVLISRSPELFFSVDGGGKLQAKPMKGTVSRGATPEEDAVRSGWLQRSQKNRAENLMIVDLLRNDISRIARLGSVRVPQLYAIETYATLHQMVSVVEADLLPGTRLPEIFAALFPCGSITGAPKIRAMQIIRALEQRARDIYCGAIGWVAPDGAMSFNVAIRTLICFDGGAVRLDVGGGIVHDSHVEDEYAEALLKSRFAAPDPA